MIRNLTTRHLTLRPALPLALGVILAITTLVLVTQTSSSAADGWGPPDGAAHPQSGQLLRFENGQALGGCSGTLISPTVFMTAGHCAIRKQLSPGTDLWVTFDTTWTKLDPPTNRYRVAYAVASPDIDLGVEVLDSPVTGIEPAELAPTGTLAGLLAATTDHPRLDAVGYGQGGTPSDTNPQSWIVSTRRSAPVEMIRVSGANVQTRGNLDHENPTNGCAGNSGGGLFLPDTDVLAGIMALADPMCARYGLGVRVDTSAARAFLAGFVAVP
jgi:hypothetical protein